MPRTLLGVTVTVTVNGTSVQAILYYVSAQQIAAILPSSTPVGTGQITVTNGQQTSVPHPMHAVQSAFGVLTMNGVGTGPAAAFDRFGALLTFTHAANPGDTIVLWGTGVGPVTGDETQVQGQTPSSLPMEVAIGGVSAVLTYHGRSQFPGVDQIDLVIPASTPPGCYVSVAVKTGNFVSNFASIPVAASGQICSDPVTGLSMSALQTLANKPSLSLGEVMFGHETAGNTPFPVDTATASFRRYTWQQFDAIAGSPSIGSCAVNTLLRTAFDGIAYHQVPAIVNPIQGTPLDVGKVIDIMGPQNSVELNWVQTGTFTITAGVNSNTVPSPPFIPAAGGMFEVDDGPGGADVGGFSRNVSLASTLVWTNDPLKNLLGGVSVSLSSGFTFTWSGGDPSGYVQISGVSTGNGSGAGFVCNAPVAAGQFTIPATVLAAIPAGGGSLSFGYFIGGQSFTAAGLDFGFIDANLTITHGAAYQ